VRTIQGGHAGRRKAICDPRMSSLMSMGVPVSSARELQNEILKKKIGAQVSLAVWRNGKKTTVTVTYRRVADRYEQNWRATRAPALPR